jgi:hypothetical protein
MLPKQEGIDESIHHHLESIQVIETNQTKWQSK